MSSQFPTNIVTTTNIPTASPSATLAASNHTAIHNNLRDEVIAVETAIGITGSTDNTSLTYKTANITGGDRAIGASQTVSVSNKTLGTGTKVALGSDATGDTYYNGGSGTLTRVGIGSTGQILTVAGGVPTWATNPGTAVGSYASAGILQGLTDAATSGLTIASGVVSVNSGTAANNIIKLNGSAQIPAVDGSLLTGIPQFAVNTDTTATYLTYPIPINVTSTTAATGWTVGGTGGLTVDGAASYINISGSTNITLATPIVGTSGTAADYDYSSAKVIRYKNYLKLSQASTDRKGWGFVLADATVHTAETDITNGSIRFILNTTTLYSQNSNGSTSTTTNIGSGITLTNWNMFEIVFTPGVDIKFYINGTLKATHTTNLPTTGAAKLCYGVNTNGWSIHTMPPVISVQV